MTDEQELKSIVKQKYGEVAEAQGGCCAGCCGPSPAGVDFSEGYTGLEGYVQEADLGLGCGLPTEWAGIQAGQTVLDLGSGAGNDVFVARSLVGDTGKVVGVDMVPAMNVRARATAERLELQNVEFLDGEIEDLPLADRSVDVAVSNCVLNLVPDKERAFAEIHRVLKPGGHFCLSDIVLEGELPPALAEAAALYAGCVSGAQQRDRYLGIIGQAGFTRVVVRSSRPLRLPDEVLEPFLTPDQIAAFRSSGVGILSVTVLGWKE